MENKNPSIKIFGKQIQMPPHSEAMIIDGSDFGATSERVGIKGKAEKDAEVEKAIENRRWNKDALFNQEESTNPETPSIEEKTATPENAKTDEEQGKSTNSQDKILKKPDKILPCPRCNSMDTKFCYYNNYKINQPRHFCKACQRYWTNGGTMRNMPVGAGRRKNKNSPSHYSHISISESLQAAQLNVPSGPTLNGRVLSFGFDAPSSKAEQKVLNRMGDGFQKISDRENGDDCSTGFSVTVSNSMEEGGAKYPRESYTQNINGLPCQPFIPGVPWPSYPWKFTVSPLAFCPPGFPSSFYPSTYWTIPCFHPELSCHTNKGPDSPSTGKHSRDDEMVKADTSNEKESPRQKKGCVLFPQTERNGDPSEVAKSSIWTALGIKNGSVSRGGLFKDFQSKGHDNNHVPETSPVLHFNPAALSRSLNFHESS